MNPNEYDDDQFVRWSTAADSAIVSLWEAGAEIKDIEAVLENAMENATEQRASVTITLL